MQMRSLNVPDISPGGWRGVAARSGLMMYWEDVADVHDAPHGNP